MAWPAEFEDQAGMVFVDEVERVAQVQARDGAPEPLSSPFSLLASTMWTVEFVFQP